MKEIQDLENEKRAFAEKARELGYKVEMYQKTLTELTLQLKEIDAMLLKFGDLIEGLKRDGD